MLRQLALAGAIVAVMTVGARAEVTPSCPVPCDGVCRPGAHKTKAVGARSRTSIRSRRTASGATRNPARGATPAPEGMRVAWDPETRTWGAPIGPGAAMADPDRLSGPELPFQAPVEFDLPGGGRGIAVGASGLEQVVVFLGPDGRLRFGCLHDSGFPTTAPGPVDR